MLPILHAKAALHRKQTVVAKMFWKISGVQNRPDDSVEKDIALHVAEQNHVSGHAPGFAKMLRDVVVVREVMGHLIGDHDIETFVFKRK